MWRIRIIEVIEAFSPGLKKILANTGWLMLDRLIRMGMGVLVGVWIARYLGPDRFGTYSFALSFVALFGTLITFGLENIVVKELVLNPSIELEILGTGFAIRVVGAVFIPILAYSAIQLIFPADHQGTVLVMILCSAFIFQTFETITWYFQAHVRSKFNVWATNLAFVIATGVRVILIERRAPVWQFAVTQVLELALAATGLAIAYKSIGGRITAWRLNLTLARQMLLQSWPVILSGMAIVTYMRIDMVMLKSMSGDVSVGIYAAATKVSEVWYFIPMAVVGSVTPAIIRARDQPLLYYQRLRRLFAFMTFLGLVIGSVLALLSTWIIHTLYSDAYIAAAPVLAVHVWASVFVFLGVAQAPWDFAENRLKLGLYRTLAGAISNIALNLILIPKYAAMGAAVATVVSYAISGVLANACYAPTRPIFRLQVLSLRLTDMFIKDNSGHSGLGES